MVGYPTETREEFNGILEVFKNIEYDSAYMYAYSPRAWTVSALMKDIDEEERKERLSELIEVQNKITTKKNKKMVNKIYSVITEKKSSKNKDEWFGFADNGKPVVFRGASFSGELCRVKITELRGWTPYGFKMD
jgi:tRNA-2-methylthio-N6-dimethylallyladenosine synthase